MEPRELWERNTRLAEAFCGSDDRVRQAQAVLDEAQADRARTLAAFAVTVGSDTAVANLMGLPEREVRVARRTVGKDDARTVAERLLAAVESPLLPMEGEPEMDDAHLPHLRPEVMGPQPGPQPPPQPPTGQPLPNGPQAPTTPPAAGGQSGQAYQAQQPAYGFSSGGSGQFATGAAPSYPAGAASQAPGSTATQTPGGAASGQYSATTSGPYSTTTTGQYPTGTSSPYSTSTSSPYSTTASGSYSTATSGQSSYSSPQAPAYPSGQQGPAQASVAEEIVAWSAGMDSVLQWSWQSGLDLQAVAGELGIDLGTLLVRVQTLAAEGRLPTKPAMTDTTQFQSGRHRRYDAYNDQASEDPQLLFASMSPYV